MSLLLFTVFFVIYCHIYCESKHRYIASPVEPVAVEEIPTRLVDLRKYAVHVRGIKGAGRMNKAQILERL